MKKIIISLLFVLLNVIIANSQTVFEEAFANDSLPPGWSVDSAGNTPVLGWAIGGGGPITGWGFDSHFFAFSYLSGSGPGDTTDLSLITATFDPSLLTNVYLAYAEYYQGQHSKIEVSIDGGSTWDIISNLTYTHGYNYTPNRNVIDLTPFVGGQQNVKVKFHFKTVSSTGTWYIDSVRVSDQEYCNNPADSGYTRSTQNFVCSGSSVDLRLESLSKGIGQTYQWQYKNASTGNVFTDIAGGVNETLNSFIHNGNTFYQCLIMCQGDTAHSYPLQLNDTPNNTFYITDNGVYGSICTGSNDTLKLIVDSIPGIGYQWTQSPVYAWGNYNNIPGANGKYYVISDTNTIEWYYACKQVCMSNGKLNFSDNRLKSFFNPNPLCYCISFNSNICYDTTGGYLGSISDVSITGTGFQNPSLCNNALYFNNSYSYFSPSATTTATLSRNTVYTFNVTTDSASGLNTSSMWIDYDRNGNFDSYEYTQIAFSAPNLVPQSKSVLIPSWATPGLTGMRVRSSINFPPNNNPCLTQLGGETEDYMITIDTTVGITPDPENGTIVMLWPNPVTNKLTIASSALLKNSHVVIVDAMGNTVKEESITEAASTWQIDVEGLRCGVYFLKIALGENVVAKKFVKNN